MVEREYLQIDVQRARELIAAASLHRLPSGEWTLILRVEGDLQIDEHRSLPLNRELRLQGRQEGRRPNPAAYGIQVKKSRKKKGR